MSPFPPNASISFFDLILTLIIFLHYILLQNKYFILIFPLFSQDLFSKLKCNLDIVDLKMLK